jgi:hypothetical protein
MLLLEEKSIALWQTYMDSCKASEFKTGRNELGVLSSGGSWEDDLGEAPSLQDLVDADDFKTPKKVRIIPSLSREADEDYTEAEEIGVIPPLNIDLSGVTPLEGNEQSSENLALRKIMFEWDGLAKQFGALKERFLAHEGVTGRTKDHVVTQFLECNHYVNELGNKARLLASRIGKDGRMDQA